MSKKCKAYSASKIGLEPADNRKAFYAGWDSAIREALAQPEFVLNGIDCSCGRKWRVVNNTLTASEQPEQEPVAWELRAGKTDQVLIEITNNPQRAHDWKASLEEVVPLYAAPPQSFTYEQVKAHIQAALLSSSMPQLQTFTGENPFPPQRKPLTEREILDLLPDAQHGWTTAFYGKWVARAVERAHGIKE